jgi:hypothetical protein
MGTITNFKEKIIPKDYHRIRQVKVVTFYSYKIQCTSTAAQQHSSTLPIIASVVNLNTMLESLKLLRLSNKVLVCHIIQQEKNFKINVSFYKYFISSTPVSTNV